jgi:CheY-like chemotaxis protein
MFRTILVVDDEPVVLRVVSMILDTAGFQVLAAPDGRAALEICKSTKGPIDLLLTDVKMPGMDGLELARFFQEQRPRVPIVFMSGHTSEIDVKHLLSALPQMDGHAFVGKPFTSTQLTSAVENALKISEAASDFVYPNGEIAR